MSQIELIIAYWLFGRAVRQGAHRDRITQLLMMLRIRFADEFTEDNHVTQVTFLSECFGDAMNAKMLPPQMKGK